MKPSPFFCLVSVVLFPVVSDVRGEAPPNDVRANAVALVADQPLSGTTAGATLEEGEPVPEWRENTVWYAWTADGPGPWEVRVESGWGYTGLTAYEQHPDGTLAEKARASFQRPETGDNYPSSKGARFYAAPGMQYSFQVYSNGAQEFSLTLRPLTGMPAQDAFAAAQALPGVVANCEILTAQATLEPAEPRTGTAWHSSVWRTWTAPAAGFWLLKFEGGLANAGVDVWRGNVLSGLTSALVASADGDAADGGEMLPSVRAVVQAAAGETLRVRVLSNDDLPARLTILPATAGDLFAQPVELGSGETFSHTRPLTDSVTLERGEPAIGQNGTQWLAWDCPATGVYELSSSAPWPQGGGVWCSGFTPVVGIVRGAALGSLTPVPTVPLGIVDGPLRFRATAGERIRIRAALSGFGGCYSNFADGAGNGGVVLPESVLIGPSQISLSLRRIQPQPANDDFALAGDLGSSADVSISGDNTGATNEPGEIVPPYHAGDSVWHRWTAPATGRYEFRVTSEALLEARVYRGTVIDALAEVAYGRGYTGQTPVGDVQLRFEVAAGVVHYFRLAGNGYGQQGVYAFRLRRMTPPANDLLASATVLASSVPVSTAGDTTDATAEVPLEYSPSGGDIRARTSSIWWRWTAPADGVYEMRAPASLGVLDNGVRLSYTFDIAWNAVRFQAVAGHVYHLRVAHDWSNEGPVTLTVDRTPGHEHSTPDQAFDAGADMRFSTPLISVMPGAIYFPGGQRTGAFWVRWTAPASGWVSVDSAGSERQGSLAAYEAAATGRPLAYTSNLPSLMNRERDSWTLSGLSGRTSETRGLLTNRFLRDATLVPDTRRLLAQVTAGTTYLFNATPPENGLTGMKINLRPAGAPPAVPSAQVRTAADAGAYSTTVTFSVTSPNGLTFGEVSLPPGTAAFTDAHRISGDAFAGEYRVALPFHDFDPAAEMPLTFNLADAAGAWVPRSTVTPTTVTQPGALLNPDNEGPRLDGIVSSPARIVLDGADVPVTLELGITDGGGSGFAEGEILFSPLNGVGYGAQEMNQVRFGPAQRVRGDACAGVYAVSFTLPAAYSGGALACRLRDAAGNLAGQWNYHSVFVLTDSDSINTPTFTPSLPLPLVLEQRQPSFSAPVLFREATADVLPVTGQVRLRGRLSHPAGITGGSVTLVDEHGVVETSIAFTAAARVSGTAMDGFYEILVPTPPHGFGGPHWLAWQAWNAEGAFGIEREIGPVILPDRTTGDARRPRLTRFQISPAAVNLLAGPATVTLSLAASDDQPGLTIRVGILDSDGRELATRTLACTTPAFDCPETLTLPQVLTTGPSAAARVVVELTDAAGRTEIYGQPWSPAWPDAAAAVLTLAPTVPDAFTRWSAAWSGLAGLPVDAARNTDADAWPDIMEFAFGTDPSVAESRDPLASRLPQFSVMPILSYPEGNAILSRWRFTPAPWFAHDTDRFRCEGWQITAEESVDLQNWQALPLPARLQHSTALGNDAAVQVESIHPMMQRHHWFRAVVRSQAAPAP